jgi:hypothetical protein
MEKKQQLPIPSLNLIVDMEIWRYGNMEIWRYGDMEIWRYGDTDDATI